MVRRQHVPQRESGPLAEKSQMQAVGRDPLEGGLPYLVPHQLAYGYHINKQTLAPESTNGSMKLH